ncbi:MAG: hypothetical protein ACYS17_13770 [Planctomycetota bacterium]|jgi:hypothetical protein
MPSPWCTGVKIVIKNRKMRVLKKFRTRKDTYLIEAVFPDRFPYSPMEVFVRQPRLKKSPPHQYSKGQLCLHESGGVGPETTAKVYIDWAIQWIRLYERWLGGKSWPPTNYS